MSINKVIVLGTVTDAGPTLRYSEGGKPVCRLTLRLSEPGREGQDFHLFLPVVVYGPGAESTAAQVEAGDLVAVEGKLAWSSQLKKDGSKLGLVVSCFGTEVITKAAQAVDTSGSTHASEKTPQP